MSKQTNVQWRGHLLGKVDHKIKPLVKSPLFKSIKRYLVTSLKQLLQHKKCSACPSASPKAKSDLSKKTIILQSHLWSWIIYMRNKVFLNLSILFLTYMLKWGEKLQKAFFFPHMKMFSGFNFTWFVSGTFIFTLLRKQSNILKDAVCEKKGINSTNRNKTNIHFWIASRRWGEVKYQAVSKKDSWKEFSLYYFGREKFRSQ